MNSDFNSEYFPASEESTIIITSGFKLTSSRFASSLRKRSGRFLVGMISARPDFTANSGFGVAMEQYYER
jgi:hypothetical protein